MNLLSFFRKGRARKDDIPQVLGEALGDNTLLLSSEAEFSGFREVVTTDDEGRLRTEYLILVMYLQTIACQIVFKDDRDLASQILDEYHKHVFRSGDVLQMEIPPDQTIDEILRTRYAQYRTLLRTEEHSLDLGFFVQQIPYDFLANVLGTATSDVFNNPEIKSRYGLQTAELSVWVGEVLKEFIDRLTKARKKL